MVLLIRAFGTLGHKRIGGHALRGAKLVRMVYLDEAGISNPKHEPFVVVAGIIVHADDQWHALEGYLSAKRHEATTSKHPAGAERSRTEKPE